MPRGFLPWGLSNTCPQGGAIRAPVACDGQVSDNPKQVQSFVTGFFEALEVASAQTIDPVDQTPNPQSNLEPARAA